MIGNDVQKAADILRQGGLVAIPTETVYGLAANGFNSEAVLRIFEAKNRPSFDPLILHLCSTKYIERVAAIIPEKAKQLADTFWPGPLTLILPKTHLVPDVVTSGLPFVGLRQPNHPLLKELFEHVDFPLAAPSANPFGMVSPTTAQHVEDQLGDRIDYILDGGPCTIGVESTIVSLEDPDRPKILRYGAITQEQIEEVIGSVGTQISSSSKPSSPGQLDRHYATSKPLELIESAPQHKSEQTFIIGFGADVGNVFDLNLSPTSDLHEAARKLFSFLREAD